MCVSDYWNEWKGIEYLCNLSKILPNNYLLVLVGGEVDISSFKNTIHIEQIKNRNELSRIYSSSNVYISTSQTETLGLAPCEAQICGCPVVTFGCGGSKETIENGISGYIVENKNVNAMLSIIKNIIEAKALDKEKIIKNGLKFSEETASKKYADLYKKII